MQRRSDLFFYALPAFSLAMPTLPAYVFLPSFYAEDLGLGLALVGGLLLVARAFDVVTDPLVGLLSDRLPTRFGRRKPWIALGGLLAGFALVQLFSAPEAAGALHLLIWAVVLYLGWTLISVPYSAWGAELSGDYQERARITSWREAFQVFGILAAGSVPVIVTQQGGSQAEAMAALAWVAVLAGGPAIALTLWRVREADVHHPTDQTRHPLTWASAKTILANRPFARLLGAWFVNGLANGLPAVLFPLYLRDGLSADDQTKAILIAVYFAAAVFGMPLWPWAARHVSKHRLWCLAMVAACISFAFVPLIPEGGYLAFGLVCVVTGLALGADLALPPALQADVVDLDTLRQGEQRAGLFFALWSMGTKLALAAAVGIGFPALEFFGPASLVILYAIVPVALKVCAIGLVWNHPLDERRHGIIQRRLQQRARNGSPQPCA
ncbi:MAG: MFS transporter [Magnetovibrionaceae bacterium]